MERNSSLGEMLCGIGLAVLGIYTVVSASRWEFFGINGPGPGFLPIIYGLIMSSFAVMLTVHATKAWRNAPRGSGERADRGGLAAAVVTLVALAASVPLMSVLGFVVGFGLALFFILLIVFGRSAVGAAVTAAAIVIALHLTFKVFLGSPLPTGMFWSF